MRIGNQEIGNQEIGAVVGALVRAGASPAQVGEALRGMQQSSASQFDSLRSKLAGLMQGGGHPGLRSPAAHPIHTFDVTTDYMDASPIGAVTTVSAIGGATGTAIPSTGYSAQGSVTPYQQFKGEKLILSETVTATFTESGQPNVTSGINGDANDILLVSANVGGFNCLSYQPTFATGLDGRAFTAQALGNGISWPTQQIAVPLVLQYLILPGVQYLIAIPSGFALGHVDVLIKSTVLGKQVRF